MKRYFTPAEANATLVLVTPIVRDILDKRFKAIAITNDVKKLKENSLLSEPELHERLDGAEKILDTINYHLEELAKIGCVLKDTTLGLIDFPCQLEDREVNLCWRFGEPKVAFWHEISNGYKERKPIDASFSPFQLAMV